MSEFRALPAPKHCPAPDPAFPYNEGAEIARVTRLLGGSLQPWQRLTLNRGTQWRPDRDARGRLVRRYKYNRVLVSVPRQSGKTFLTGPLQLHRMLLRPGSECLYTAQTGADAGKRMKELITLVVNSPAGALVRPRYSNGSEGLQVIESGSTLTRFSPTMSAVHGGHPHLVVLDEVWKHSRELGDGLIGAISPAQVTIREEAQIWMVSTKGTAKSEWMNDLIEEGISGEDPSMCYVEWSMPEGADPYSPQTWRSFHPAIGNTISVDALETETRLPYAEFMRGYMNVVVAADDPIIPMEDWDHMAGEPKAVPDLNDCAVGYEAAAGGAGAAVVAAWHDLDGATCIRVLRQAPGAGWVPAYVAALQRRWPRVRLYADDGGPTRRLTDAIRQRDDIDATSITTLNVHERETADGNLLALALESASLRHDGSSALRVAVANAVLRETNGTRRFDRDKSTAPIPALIAASVACYGIGHREEFWVLA